MKLRPIRFASIILLAAGIISDAGGATTICTPQTMWDRTYGGPTADFLYDVADTGDGGFIATGNSYAGGFPSAPLFGGYEVLLTRVDSSGEVAWQRHFGGASEDQGQSVVPTSDGGFIVGAYSASGITGNKSSTNHGGADFWLIRVGPDGTKLWDKSFGGTRGDYLNAVVPMPAGGFLICGDSQSGISGNKTSPRRDTNNFDMDVWVIRIDSDGNKIWEQSYGGNGEDRFGGAVPTTDGGILLGSSSYSGATGNKTIPRMGGADYWLLRLDANGEILWQRSYGGSGWDELRGITATSDGGFLLAGNSQTGIEGDKTTPSYGFMDYWIVRIDASGAKIWENGFGGTDLDQLQSVAPTRDGGFLLAGNSASPPGGARTSPWRGGTDYWIVRVDATGQKQWEESYGGLQEEYVSMALQTIDGRFLLAGSSYSTRRGNKTAPSLGSSDFWLLQLAPENPEDCDNDQVPDSADQCLSTSLGDVTDAHGCGLTQLCPCASPWPTPSNYVACVSSNSARLVADGLMSEEQRQSVLKFATNAYCPPPSERAIVFGLTNLVLGSPTFESTAEYGGHLYVNDAEPSGSDGTSIQLGQADSGVFIYPYASVWGSFDERWFMLGSAFGRVNGMENTPVSRIRARKPNYEVYPAEVDLSPLGPASVTWQIWSGDTLVAETNVAEAIGEVTVHSSQSVGPRANPFWRMRDGSVGALIEFTEPLHSASVAGPFGNYTLCDRIFVRANSPSNLVDYVSRVDVVVGGGLYGFEVLDERPGVFGRGHRVLGPGLLLPSLGRLQVDSQQTEDFVGVLIETHREKRLDVTLEPVSLTNESAILTFSLSGFFTDPTDSLGALRFETSSNLTSVSSFILITTPTSALQLRAYQAGVLQGQSVVTNSVEIGTFAVSPEPDTAKVIGVGGGVSVQDSTMLGSFTFDRVISLRVADGQTWRGDHFQVVATNATLMTNMMTNTLSALSVFTSKIPGFAITSEDSNGAPPSIAIRLAGPELTLSWPARNLPIVLEASDTLPGTFNRVATEPVYQSGQYRVTLPASSTGHRFFRLRTAD